ncbi:helical backbone metal receptor [Candidatus Poriferisodalis sp.]|uniref:helical backbone metal receptor n=1 Tax=Candidatus Poriferisodalis sp. TaxID=3101277 RepID=UPI003B5B0675
MTLPAIRARSANALPATRIVSANTLPAMRIVSANTLPKVRIGAEWSTEPLPENGKPLEHPSGRNVRVFVPIWRRPYMTIGARTYGASLLTWCGVDVAFADRGTYPTIDAGDLSADHLDIVLAPTEPYPWHLRHLDELAKIAPTHVIDGQDLFWWGTRTPGAVVRVAETVKRALRQQGPPQTARSSVTVQWRRE